ncbi:MAG: endonuclease/exonuclease/phosphatase family protein [Candidatus Krumholzibacteriia bacterium]
MSGNGIRSPFRAAARAASRVAARAASRGATRGATRQRIVRGWTAIGRMRERRTTARLLAGTMVLVAAAALLVGAACQGVRNFGRGSVPVEIFTRGPMMAAAGSTFTVVSYNLRHGREVDLAIAELGNHPVLGKADIILLQEMDGAGVEQMAGALGLNAAFAPSSRDPEGRSFGTAILTAAPLRDVRPVVLPHEHPVTGQGRVALLATAAYRDHALRVACVHLEIPPLPLAARLEQLDHVIGSLDHAEIPLLVGGDFNTITRYEMNLVSRAMRQAGLRRVNIGAKNTAYRSFLGWRAIGARVDHFFVRGLDVLAGGVVLNTDSSDHRPIWAQFSWPDEPPRRLRRD